MSDARKIVCDHILKIMGTYHDQERDGDVGTPGGLEHMGDVWRLFEQWESLLQQQNSSAEGMP